MMAMMEGTSLNELGSPSDDDFNFFTIMENSNMTAKELEELTNKVNSVFRKEMRQFQKASFTYRKILKRKNALELKLFKQRLSYVNQYLNHMP